MKNEMLIKQKQELKSEIAVFENIIATNDTVRMTFKRNVGRKGKFTYC